MGLRNQIDRAAALKGELVAYASGPGFVRLLEAEMLDAAPHTDDPQDAWVTAVESMIYDRPERGGKTLIERYLLGHKQLAPEDRLLLEGWRDRALYGVFEVASRKGDRLMLVNLVDELGYETYSTMGAAAIRPASPGNYVVTRVVPVGDAWLLSGIQRLFTKRDRTLVGSLVAGLIENDPTGPFRNAAKRELALEINRTHHGIFLSLFGADAVAGTGRDVAEHYRRFIRECNARILADMPEATDRVGLDAAPDLADGIFPDDLLAADDVVLLNHPVKGVGFYQDHARVEDAHRAPPSRPKAQGVRLVRNYLDDETIPAYVLARLAAAYPDTVDRLYRLVLRRPEFRWESDGDALLRERKPAWYDTADIPDLMLLPAIAIEAMRDATAQ